MMIRLFAMVVFLLIAVPVRVAAQPATKVYQVGWLMTSPSTSGAELLDAFRSGLRELGWVDGQNVRIVYRYAEGRLDRLPDLAADLVRANVDVILAPVPAALEAARNATSTIPIVMVLGPDPVAAGLVTSLARPGGNITGLTSLSAELALKQLELLREIVPGLARVAVLWNRGNWWHASGVKYVEAAGRALRVDVQAVDVDAPAKLDGAFAAIMRERADAVLVLPDPLTFAERGRLAELASRHRLPTMGGLLQYTEAGALVSYWPNAETMYRRAAGYVHRILNGTRPGDLPIEQPTSFELVLNLKTAKKLGLTIPSTVLLRADRLLE
jgi:putative tryptophan/tyrosine transport system substrate-binding protein